MIDASFGLVIRMQTHLSLCCNKSIMIKSHLYEIHCIYLSGAESTREKPEIFCMRYMSESSYRNNYTALFFFRNVIIITMSHVFPQFFKAEFPKYDWQANPEYLPEEKYSLAFFGEYLCMYDYQELFPISLYNYYMQQ